MRNELVDWGDVKNRESSPSAEVSLVEVLARAMTIPLVTMTEFINVFSKIFFLVRNVTENNLGELHRSTFEASKSRRCDKIYGSQMREFELESRKEKTVSKTNLDDDTLKLVRYSIVFVKREEEEILDFGEKLVKNRMSGDGFATWVISEYESRNPMVRREPSDGQYFRVHFEVLDRWSKQPLHYEEKQLDYLQEISNKIA